MIIVIK